MDNIERVVFTTRKKRRGQCTRVSSELKSCYPTEIIKVYSSSSGGRYSTPTSREWIHPVSPSRGVDHCDMRNLDQKQGWAIQEKTHEVTERDGSLLWGIQHALIEELVFTFRIQWRFLFHC